ncbi:hypothetical protein CCP3SC15_10037 [Gammaproteobacteria bacterium]
MTTKLILFTSAFPYGLRETFLVPELPHLCQAFDRIVIMPMRGAGSWRTLPANVEVAEPLWTTRNGKIRFFVRAMLSPRSWALFFRESAHVVKTYSRFHVALFVNILHWALYRGALERCDAVREALRSPEGVVAYSYWGHIPSLAMPTLADAGIPSIVRYHRADLYLDGMNAYGYYHRSIRYFPWRDEIARKSTRSVFISQHGLDYFLENWGKSLSFPEQAVVRRLGVDDCGVNPGRSESRSEPFVVVSCSTVAVTKRVHLIAAFVKELSKSKEVVWYHFGPGECNLLAREVETADSPQLQIHLRGWVENDEIMEFYLRNHVDLFVNLSLSEGVPVSIMEAVSFGIPTLATDVGGSSEVVLNGESGLIIGLNEATDSKRLTEMVLDALLPGGALERCTPRSVWKERFDACANFSTFAQELRRLANG